MWHTTLGRTGSEVSALACGSNALGGYDEFTAEIVFNYALDRGITFIETGRMYDEGKTEQWIGKAVSHQRGEYVLASKCRRSEAAARLTALITCTHCALPSVLDQGTPGSCEPEKARLTQLHGFAV